MVATGHDWPEAGSAHDTLGRVMSRLARELQSEHDSVEATLGAITSAAIRIVPGADECGITYVVGRSKVEPRAWTSDLPKGIDSLQERLGEGPCLDAVWDEQFVLVDDVAADERWPRFARQAGDLGVGSMLCLQLFVEGGQMGALNLYARTPGAFDGESREVGLMLAGHAAVALVGAEHEANLRRGMDNRDLIGQAKGILMERHKLTADQAFGVLARASQELNRKLADIALALTDTGAMPRGRSDTG